jgi:hypothetical protein
MSTAEKLLDKMRRNPRNWRIEDLIVIARKKGATIRNPRGSHVIFTHESTKTFASIPAHKPIKPVYIRQFLIFIDAIKEQH